MGLLDDAIREHLDLKRRRGADPAEVERAEHEALGPVRRNRDPGDVAEPEALAGDSGGFAYDHAEDEDWTHDSVHEPAGDGTDDLAEPGFHESELEPAPPPPGFSPGRVAPEPPAFENDSAGRAPGGDWSYGHGDDSTAEPFETAPPSSRPVSGMGGGETVEYNVEDALAADGEAEGDDVLEETPEFLQDTPDHDRLWFEQRPPRDFDFDG
jgi:hypothetical protein